MLSPLLCGQSQLGVLPLPAINLFYQDDALFNVPHKEIHHGTVGWTHPLYTFFIN